MNRLTKPLPLLGMNTVEVLLLSGFIALFALAALPRYDDSRLAADVAHARRDLAGIALAMEAYRLDNTGYPASEANSPIAPHYLYSIVDRRLLTTPVSYLDVYPQDVFWSTTTTSILYRIYAVAYVPLTSAPYYYRSYNVYPKTSWMTWSIGPDRLSNTSGYCPLPKIIENEAAPAGGYWLLSQTPAILAESNYGRLGSYNPMNGIRYDPTNGEISDGDIYRFGSEALWREN